MKQHLLIFSILGLMLNIGCQKEEPDTQYDIETDFYIDMIEDLSPTGNSLVFKTSTVLDQDCLNVGIDCRFSYSNAQAKLSFVNLLEPQDCEVGNAPATTNVSIGDLSYSNHFFEINLRDEIVSNGNLNVGSSRIIASFIEENGFEILHKTLIRVPRFTVWGYVNYLNAEDELAAVEFMNQLNEITDAIDYEEGYYGHYSIDAVGITEVTDAPANTNFSFTLGYIGTDEELETLIDEFRSTNEGLEIFLKNWQGKSF